MESDKSDEKMRKISLIRKDVLNKLIKRMDEYDHKIEVSIKHK